jgi:hypothetical protein
LLLSPRTVGLPGPPRAAGVARLRTPAVVAAGAAAALTYIGSVSPYATGNYPTCPLYALTGLYCPGCGSLRSMHSLVTGDVVESFARNPVLPPLALILAVVFVRWVVLRWRGERFVWDPPTWVPITIGIAVIVYGIARNLPGLEFLSPG